MTTSSPTTTPPTTTTPPEPSRPTAPTGPKRPRARLRPQELAARRGGVREGLDWLGRAPEARGSVLYRLVRLLARFLIFGIFRFRIATSGQEHLPRGGYLLIAAAHRGWMDPFVAQHAVPAEPRCWFLGSGPSTFTYRWRESLIHRLGGLLPVWRGGVGIEGHVRSAKAVVDAGAVFVQMPEGTVNGPAGKLGPFRPGAALIALRTGATIVPLAMAGTEELYIGRRMASRVLPPTSARELLGGDWDGVLPPADSRDELALARRVSDALAARLAPVVEELYPGTVDPPTRRRRLRRRLTRLLLGPGPIER